MSLRKKIRRETKEKIAEMKRIWKETSDKKITSDKEQLGFKKI